MHELVFIVDGDTRESGLARSCLELAGYSVRTFSSLAELGEADYEWPSLILAAAVLHDGSGLELCRQIRRDPEKANTAVIVSTVGASEEQSCAALDAGADHCLAKPFSPRELTARVKAALRNVRRFDVAPADFVIDDRAMKLLVLGSEVVTTSLEFRLVNYLARHRGQAFTRDVLLDAVWGNMRFVTPRTVDACVRRVREKIEPDLARPTYLKTVRGVGYRFDGIAVWPGSEDTCSCSLCKPSNAGMAEVGSPRLMSRRPAS